jgi:c-di-GMP-binding flagellar brake protein YcgR
MVLGEVPRLMQITGYRRIERRRSVRVTLAVPLRVDGQSVSGEEFIIRTHSHTVSQFGCLIPVDAEVAPDQTLVLMNENTRQSAQCRVVSTRRHRDGKRYLGVEFTTPTKSNFWRIAFTKPGARSLKRQYGSLGDSTAFG